MADLEHSQLFTPYVHPQSGVTIYVLTRKVAPLQQGFYFINDSMTCDGRYLWFYCGFPPSGSGQYGRTLGVVDFQTMEVRHFPETQFNDAAPFVDPLTGEVTWGAGDTLWRRGPGAKDSAHAVAALPADLIGGRAITRFATHLTRSADGKRFFIDSAFGLQVAFGTLPADGNGDYEFWHRFDRNYNHAQFSPVDPNLVLFAQEMHTDPITGLTFPITNRLWTIRKGEAPRSILPEPLWTSHEWWDAAGQHAWTVYGNEAWRVDVHSHAVEKVPWPSPVWHAHTTRDNAYVVCDSSTTRFYRGCPSSVSFLNRKTGKFVKLVDNPERPDYVGRTYHIDPHPRFVCNDQYIVFTTTLRGEIDLGLVKVADIIKESE